MCAIYKGIEIPDDDAQRVEALAAYRVLDTATEIEYDDITELAAEITGCRASYIGLFDDRRMWLKAKYGLPPDLFERPRELTLCAPTVCQNDVLVIPDLSQNQRYRELPSVKGPPHARFYCGVPLINSEGYALGTICVFDTEPKAMPPEQKDLMRRLARQLMCLLETRRKLIETADAKIELERSHARLQEEKSEAERLLLNFLPEVIAAEMRESGQVRPRYYSSATILFTDFCGFTRIAQSLEPAALVEQLNDYFSIFDEIIERHGLEKLKTIGDAYMCAGGLPTESGSHAHRVCLAALEIREAMAKVNRRREKMLLDPWNIRIGIHSGPIIAGVIGSKTFAFDIWGDAVNVAARMETHGEEGKVNASEDTVATVARFFETTPRGAVDVKNRGPVNMHVLERLKPELSADPLGLKPNDAFRAMAPG